MGKMPLAGLLGLVAAVTLVTAGCECCGRSCQRKEGKYKTPPAFQPGRTDMAQPVVPPAGATESPPPKPTDLGPVNVPPAGTTQASNLNAPPAVGGQPPAVGGQPPVSALSPPRSPGWDNRPTGEANTVHRMSVPVPPTTPSRTMADLPLNDPPPLPAAPQTLPPIASQPAAPMAPPPPPSQPAPSGTVK